MVRFALIRHAENVENRLMADIQLKMANGHYDNWKSAYLDLRKQATVDADGPLTNQGEKQAAFLAKFWAPIFKEYVSREKKRPSESSGKCKMHIYTSPTRRTLQTAAALARHLGLKMMTIPILSETTGGVVHRSDREKWGLNIRRLEQSGRVDELEALLKRMEGKWIPCGLTRSEIIDLFPSVLFHSSFPMDGKPWARFGIESVDRQYKRASQVLSFMHDCHRHVDENDLVIIVAHGGMISMILKLLLADSLSPKKKKKTNNVSFRSLDNTSVTSIVMHHRRRSGATPSSKAEHSKYSHSSREGEGCRVVVEFVNRVDHLPSNRALGYYRWPGESNPAAMESLEAEKKKAPPGRL